MSETNTEGQALSTDDVFQIGDVTPAPNAPAGDLPAPIGSDDDGDDGQGQDGAGEGSDDWSDLEGGEKAGDSDDEDEDEDGQDVEKAKPDHKVPISRLQKEVAKRRALEREVAELRAGAGQHPAPKQDAQAPAVPESIIPPNVDQIDAYVRQHDKVLGELEAKVAEIEANPEKYSQLEYTKALAAASERKLTGRQIVASQIAEQERAQAQAQQQTHAEYAGKLLANYSKALDASTIPGIQEARKRFETHAPKLLPPHVREAILSSDEPDVFVAALASDRKLFNEFSTAPNSPATFFKLAKVAGAFRAKASDETAARNPAQPVQAPRIDQVRRKSENSASSPYDSEGRFVMTPDRLAQMRKNRR